MKVLLTIFCILILLAAGFASLAARTWYVKPDGTGDAPTIQAGIDSATVGDTVLLAAGTYTGVGNWGINFMGKAITVVLPPGFVLL